MKIVSVLVSVSGLYDVRVPDDFDADNQTCSDTVKRTLAPIFAYELKRVSADHATADTRAVQFECEEIRDDDGYFDLDVTDEE
jgi:hypothetical protein